MILSDEAASRGFGARLAALVRPGDVVTLSGSLGAGKTSIARGLIAALGHDGEVPSPSFAIVQPYEMLSPPLWHVDLYRIDQPDELLELGLESIREEGVLLVEWPERAGEGAFPDALHLTIAPDGRGRRLTADVPAAWEDRWPPR
jgi:tRNA threonylcarbamoyladenosine biosynthesis protein TsaE